jgi:two-component system, chemotaxis family, sensor kinase Cph1
LDRKKAEILHDSQHACARDLYVAVLSYKLRKPLQSLLSTVSTLKHAPTTTSELIPALDMIGSQVETQGRLIDDILEYSRIGTRGAELQPTDFEAVFECALVNLRKSIDETDAVVTRDSLPSVWADGTQMVQLVQNLIGNAIKYRSEAPPRIHAAAQRQGADWVFLSSRQRHRL